MRNLNPLKDKYPLPGAYAQNLNAFWLSLEYGQRPLHFHKKSFSSSSKDTVYSDFLSDRYHMVSSVNTCSH